MSPWDKAPIGAADEYKKMMFLAFSDRASFSWSDTNTSATVTFVADDATTISLTMSAATLTNLRADIAAELARKPQTTPDR